MYCFNTQLILSVVGTPSEDFNQRMGAERVKTYISKLPKKKPVKLDKIYTDANPVGLELLGRMLKLDPCERITAKDALRHEYLANYHDIDDEPVCFLPFDFSFDKQSLSKESLKLSILDEIQHYSNKPDAVAQPSGTEATCRDTSKDDSGKV